MIGGGYFQFREYPLFVIVTKKMSICAMNKGGTTSTIVPDQMKIIWSGTFFAL